MSYHSDSSTTQGTMANTIEVVSSDDVMNVMSSSEERESRVVESGEMSRSPHVPPPLPLDASSGLEASGDDGEDMSTSSVSVDEAARDQRPNQVASGIPHVDGEGTPSTTGVQPGTRSSEPPSRDQV